MSAGDGSARPIIFSGPMVKAILAGRKSMSRRVVNPQPESEAGPTGPLMWGHPDLCGLFAEHVFGGCFTKMVPCPYGAPGDRLWVREIFRAIEDPGAERHEVRRKYRDEDGETHYVVVDYKADAPTRIMDQLGKPEWKSPIHMPRWASRVTLEVTAVRVERLQEITEEDARAEGIRSDILPACGDHPDLACYVSEPDDNHAYRTRVEAFRKSWDHVNGKRPGCSWDANPWVWVLSFRKTEAGGRAGAREGGPRVQA